MKRHLNTLYVTTQGAYLSLKGETLVARVDDTTKARFPLHAFGSIACFGQVSMSPPLMGACGERGIGVSFFGRTGRFLARVVGPASGNVLLRRAQYRAADDPDRAAYIARCVVVGKVANSRTVLQRHLRDHGGCAGSEALAEAAEKLAHLLTHLEGPLELEVVRGLEGDAARIYFGVFDHLLRSAHEGFEFERRSRRPPLNPVNSLLSFCYTLLLHDVRSACEGVGLDPQVGYLHRDRPGRPSLALDLMEELRPVLADRLTLSLINRGQVAPKSFRQSETGGIEMNDEARRTVVNAYQERKNGELRHPFLDEKLTIGLIAHVQAKLMARHLRGDLDAYPPFFWR